MSDLLISASIALPEANGSRQRIDSKDFNGQIWVRNTAYYGEKPYRAITEREYQNMVEKAISEMQQNHFEKVVLSRIIELQCNDSFDEKGLFLSLCEKYPTACAFHFSLDNGQQWFGATPERLLVKRGHHYSTLALAGTRSANDKVPWTDKEIHEEGVVKSYIVSTLNANGATEVVVSERYERQAGSLVHLAHDISFTSSQNVQFWADVLHPTPAVCGLPQLEARHFIAQHEPHGRGYYTGLLGVEHPNQDADVYVLLRCGMRTANAIKLFVGGGITAKSQWVDEFRETEYKAEILKSLLGH